MLSIFSNKQISIIRQNFYYLFDWSPHVVAEIELNFLSYFPPDSNQVQLPDQKEYSKKSEKSSQFQNSSDTANVSQLYVKNNEENWKEYNDDVGDVPIVLKVHSSKSVDVQENFHDEDT